MHFMIIDYIEYVFHELHLDIGFKMYLLYGF